MTPELNNIRDALTLELRTEIGWNPWYCFYGYPHLVNREEPDRCQRCWAHPPASVQLSHTDH